MRTDRRPAVVLVGPATDGVVGAVPEDYAVTVVEDDGPGVPPDRREEMLELGVTTTADGTGLGLGIVDRVADAHGWSVRLEESDAGGLRVAVDGVAPG